MNKLPNSSGALLETGSTDGGKDTDVVGGGADFEAAENPPKPSKSVPDDAEKSPKSTKHTVHYNM